MALTQLKTGAIADDAVTTDKLANAINTARDANTAKTSLEDNSVTLAKMAGGTDGQIITYDASGDPVAVGPGTDGQVLTSTGAGSPPAFEAIPASGKILQVLQVVKTDTASTSSATYGDVSGLSQAITTVAGSKVLVIGNVFYGTANAAYSTWFRLVRVDVDGSTNYPWLGDADSTVTRASAGGYNSSYTYKAESSSFTCLDTPSGAGSHTYKIQWRQGYTGGFTSYIGRDGGGSTDASRGRVPSSLTLIEVAA